MYSFLEKASEEKDLIDIIKNLEEPLSIVEEIKAKSKTFKKESDVSAILHNLLNLVDSDLPQLIENYCQLSMDYRNTHIVRNNQTTRDILIDNIKNIIVEIHLQSREFNNFLNKKFLTQEHFIRDKLTPKSVVHLEGDPEPITLHFKDSFNYQKPVYINKNLKKPIVNAQPVRKSETMEQHIESYAPVVEEHIPTNRQSNTMNNVVISVCAFCVLSALALLFFTTSLTNSKPSHEDFYANHHTTAYAPVSYYDSSPLVFDIKNLADQVKHIKSLNIDYSLINDNYIVSHHLLLTRFTLTGSNKISYFNHPIEFTSTSNSFSMNVHNLNQSECRAFSHMKNEFSDIQIDNKEVTNWQSQCTLFSPVVTLTMKK